MTVPKGYVHAKVGTCRMPGCTRQFTARNRKGVCSVCQRGNKREADRVARAAGYTPPPMEWGSCKMCSATLNRGNRSGYCTSCQRAGAWKLGPFTMPLASASESHVM